MTNAERFIKAYNIIDSLLRSIYGMDLRIGFSEVIRRCAKFNGVVAANEYKLIDYARLRNAIVHQGVREEIIAEPHTDVVEDFENIAQLIASPPSALAHAKRKKIFTLAGTVKLKHAIRTFYETGFSNIPVTKGNRLIGVLNNKLIVDKIAKVVAREEDLDDYINQTEIESILIESMKGTYYTIVSKEASITDVLEIFNKNRKMLCVILTENGNNHEKPLGIITSADIWELNEVIDNYQIL